MFGEEETFGINVKGEYNQQFHGVDGHNFKIFEVKNSSNEVAYKKI